MTIVSEIGNAYILPGLATSLLREPCHHVAAQLGLGMGGHFLARSVVTAVAAAQIVMLADFAAAQLVFVFVERRELDAVVVPVPY